MFESTEEKNFSFFRFEDLRIYHKALDFVTFSYTNVANFPDDLKRDFLDASNAIVLSIAQGSFYGNKAQLLNLLKEVRNIARTCVVYTAIAQRIDAFSDEQAEEATTHLTELCKMLGAFIISLKKKENPNQPEGTQSDLFEID